VERAEPLRKIEPHPEGEEQKTGASATWRAARALAVCGAPLRPGLRRAFLPTNDELRPWPISARSRLTRACVLQPRLFHRCLRLSGLSTAAMAPDVPDETVRSTDVWYDDGTLVIRAENTLFRVYRGILASQSDIFKDMLSVPQPSGTDADAETIEDCVVVRVQDTAGDMTRFLRALHETRYVLLGVSPDSILNTHPGRFFPTECYTNVPYFVSTMRLADKYGAHGIRLCGTQHLRTIFPISSSLYDYESQHAVRLRLSAADLMTLANLTYELRMPHLTASLAFACALEIPLNTIMDGVIVDGQTTELFARMQRNILRVRTGVLEGMEEFFFSWTTIHRNYPEASCANPDGCRYRIGETKSFLVDHAWSARAHLPPWTAEDRIHGPTRDSYDVDVWHWLPLSRAGVAAANQVCVNCKSPFAYAYRKLRNQIWQSVPGWASDCPNWSDGHED
jgi:hypothetical protein